MKGRFRHRLKHRLYKILVYLRLIDSEPVLMVDKEEVNLAELIEVQPLLDFMMSIYDEYYEEDEGCGHFLEGFGEAIGIVQFVYEEQLKLNKDIAKMHQDLEAFIKGEFE